MDGWWWPKVRVEEKTTRPTWHVETDVELSVTVCHLFRTSGLQLNPGVPTHKPETEPRTYVKLATNNDRISRPADRRMRLVELRNVNRFFLLLAQSQQVTTLELSVLVHRQRHTPSHTPAEKSSGSVFITYKMSEKKPTYKMLQRIADLEPKTFLWGFLFFVEQSSTVFNLQSVGYLFLSIFTDRLEINVDIKT